LNHLIAPKEDITKELEQIQGFLEITMSEDANEAVVRGNDLSVYMARSGKLLADAKAHKDHKLKSEIATELQKILSLAPSVANKLIDHVCADENYIINWADRINRACTHQLDWCRTVISKAKSEMQHFGYGNKSNNQ